jgi:hypothetical protein
MNEFITGDTPSYPVTLTLNDATFVIAPTDLITARLVSTDHSKAYSPEVVQSLSTPGTDLAHSLVIISFPTETTETITYQGTALIEIQISGVCKDTWFVPIKIVKGHVR